MCPERQFHCDADNVMEGRSQLAFPLEMEHRMLLPVPDVVLEGRIIQGVPKLGLRGFLER